MKDYFKFINVDAHLEILSRLSVRDLQSLKCVSKEWNSIISDCLFVNCQLKNVETVSGFFFQEKFQWCDEDIERISYIPLRSRNNTVCTTVLNFLPESVVLLSSCNGLICCRCSFPSLNPVIYVCNPIKKNWISIKCSSPSKRNSIALTFEPSKISVGEALTNFKLVSVSKNEAEDKTQEDYFIFQVYLSKTGQWRRSQEICKCKHNLFKNKGVFVDGSLFWLTDGYQIIMFDPLLELSYLINMPLPSTQFYTTPEICIGASDGKLHCVLLSEDGIQLWVLLDHFDSIWDLTFSLSLDDLENENPEFLFNLADKLPLQGANAMFPWLDLLAFSDGILFMKAAIDVCCYNFESKKMNKLCNLYDLGMNSMYFPIVVPYTMSLAPLDQV